MKKENINKIVLVSLCDNFSNQLATALSQTLDMVFCDTNALVEYELVDKNAMEKLCSPQYLKSCERKVLKHIASFENVVVSISYDYLIHNIDVLKYNSAVVFVELPKVFVKNNGDALAILAFDERTKNLKELADVNIAVRKTEIDFISRKIIENLGSVL